MKNIYKIVSKRDKNINLGDKKSQYNLKRHKNINLSEKKSQNSIKKTQKIKFR